MEPTVLRGRLPILVKTVAGALVAVVILIAGTLHVAASADGEARVTARSLNIRQGPSTSTSVIGTVKRGDLVALLDASDPGWYLITVSGKQGYVSSEYVTVEKAPQASGGNKSSSGILKTDSSLTTSSGDVITSDVLSFLTAVGYKEGDPVTVHYDGRSISFVMPASGGGAAGSSSPSQQMPSSGSLILADPSAGNGIPYPQQSAGTTAVSRTNGLFYQKGDRGSGIVQIQTALMSLGYFHEAPTGYYGDVTRAAVQAYQMARGKAVTDYVDEALFVEIIAYGAGSAPVSAAPMAVSPSASVELVTWETVDAFWKEGQIAVVTDVRTGISWQLKRWAGKQHADCEPLTVNDTALMRQAYGGTFDYVRHPMWVTVNGRTFAASLYGVPHSTQTIYDNDYNGQCCLHFLGSMTHDSARVDADHQAAVYEAFYAGQGR